MSNERMIASVIAAGARAQIRAMGMVVANQQQFPLMRDEKPRYSEEDFIKLIDEEGLGFNQVLNLFED